MGDNIQAKLFAHFSSPFSLIEIYLTDQLIYFSIESQISYIFGKQMMNYKKKNFFTKIAISCSAVYWLIESFSHCFLFREPFELVPSNKHELFLRLLVFILAILLGFLGDYHTSKLIRKEREKYQVYEAMLNASHHIINNFLNQMMLFRLEAEDQANLDNNILQIYDGIIDNAAEQLKKLENLPEVSKFHIEERLQQQ